MSATVIESNKADVFYDFNTNDLVGNSAVYYLFPPLDLYNHDGRTKSEYKHRVDDKIVNKDIAFLKVETYKDPDQDDSFSDGEFVNTNVAAAFHAISTNDYFFKYTGAASSATVPTLERGTVKPTIAEAIKLPKFSDGATFENQSLGMITPHVNRFKDLDVEGLDEGFPPENQEVLAVRLDGVQAEDVTYRCFDATPITDGDANITNANVITLQAAHFAGIEINLVTEEANGFVYDDAAYAASNKYVSAVEIVNVERDFGDLRYGDAEDNLPLIPTGAVYIFDDAEIATVEAGTSTPITIDVFGGDSFIGLHTFKISDSTYALTDPLKEADGTGTAGVPATQADKWGWYFNKFAVEGTGEEDVSRPIALKGVSQTLSVILESEANPNVAEKTSHTTYTDALPFPRVDTAGQIRSKFDYRYNLDYLRQNDYNVFFPYRTFEKNNTEFGSRVVYSDTKIYQSEVEGFDRFRVLNFVDVDESYGDITKLQPVRDNLFAFQERAIVYLPASSNVIQTSTASALEVRSGEVIGTPVFIDTVYGTQHPATVKSDGSNIFFVDSLNGSVCKLAGREVKEISRLGMETYFNAALPPATHSDLIAVWDQKKREYIVSTRLAKTAVYNDMLGLWVSEWAQTSWGLLGGIMVKDQLYLVGFSGATITTSSDVELVSAYTNNTYGSFFGVNTTPSITFYVNPDMEIPKTFDNVIISSDGALGANFNMTITKAGEAAQTSTQVLSSSPIEGNYRIKILRDAVDARMRGLNAKYQFAWNTGGSTEYALNSVITKYRPSYRPI